MVRPEARPSPKIPFASDGVVSACCVLPAGASPATVSAGAPCSRLRSWGEIPPAERSITSPHGPVRVRGGERSCGPRLKRTLQPREIGPRKGGTGRAGHFAAKATDCTLRSGWVQGVPGVWRRARSDGGARNRRDPTRRPTSGEGAFYKPSAKWTRVGRESEGLIVPLRPGESRAEGRGPALVTLAYGGKGEGMP